MGSQLCCKQNFSRTVQNFSQQFFYRAPSGDWLQVMVTEGYIVDARQMFKSVFWQSPDASQTTDSIGNTFLKNIH